MKTWFSLSLICCASVLHAAQMPQLFTRSISRTYYSRVTSLMVQTRGYVIDEKDLTQNERLAELTNIVKDTNRRVRAMEPIVYSLMKIHQNGIHSPFIAPQKVQSYFTGINVNKRYREIAESCWVKHRFVSDEFDEEKYNRLVGEVLNDYKDELYVRSTQELEQYLKDK